MDLAGYAIAMFVASLVIILLGNIAHGVNKIAGIADGPAVYIAICIGYPNLFIAILLMLPAVLSPLE